METVLHCSPRKCSLKSIQSFFHPLRAGFMLLLLLVYPFCSIFKVLSQNESSFGGVRIGFLFFGFLVSFSVITSKPRLGSILINENFDESEEQSLRSF